MVFELPADCDRRIRRFAEYLAAKVPAGRLPGRQHIVPNEITDLLPFVAMYDVVREANGDLRYRARLIGTHIVELYGHDPTGRCMDEYVPAPAVDKVVARFHQVVRTKEPDYYADQLVKEGREHVRFQRAAFPLARNGEDVDMVAVIRIGLGAYGNVFREIDLLHR